MAVAAGDLIRPLFGRATRDYERLYDYGPMLAEASVETGHILDGWWPTLARAAWANTLKEFAPEELDYRGYQAALEKAQSGVSSVSSLLSRLFGTGRNGQADNSTHQLMAHKPLLELSYRECAGPLIPVAHVTARDLLHYGWENAVGQLAARHYFVDHMWSVDELARAILKEATNAVPGYAALVSGQTNDPVVDQVLARLQCLTWTVGGYWPAAQRSRGNETGRSTQAMRTHWLQWAGFTRIYQPWLAPQPTPVKAEWIDRLHTESGRRMDLKLLRFLAYSDTDAAFTNLAPKLTNSVPLATSLLCDYSRRVNPPPSPSLEHAQRLERLFWSNPNCSLAPHVFHAYVMAGEFDATKKFYAHAMRLPYDAVRFSNQMQPRRWALAMMEGDLQTMSTVLQENETGSWMEFMVRVCDAVYRKDWVGADAIAQEGIKRYGAGPPNAPKTLEIARRLLTLREALADPAHPGHAHALGYLVNVTTLPVFQWILVNQLKLTEQDAYVFLGGETATAERRLMIQYLRGDKEGFEQTLSGLNKPLGHMASVVVACLRARLLDIKPRWDGESLCPKDAAALQQKVLEQLRK